MSYFVLRLRPGIPEIHWVADRVDEAHHSRVAEVGVLVVVGLEQVEERGEEVLLACLASISEMTGPIFAVGHGCGSLHAGVRVGASDRGAASRASPQLNSARAESP